MAQNKFKVFGRTPDSSDAIYNTDTEAYNALYGVGLKKDTLAKAEDVDTPLRDSTSFMVAVLDWLAGKLPSSALIFQSAEVEATTEDTEANVVTLLNNIKNALEAVIFTNGINTKEPLLPRLQAGSVYNVGFLKFDKVNNQWIIDTQTYQPLNEILNKINTLMGTSASKGLIYKSQSDNGVKISDKQFLYFDSEDTDTAGNKIANLKTMTY